MEKDYKGIIFIDIDGTVTVNYGQHGIPEENINAIASAKERGYWPIVNTGRVESHTVDFCHILGIDDYVAGNGHLANINDKRLVMQGFTNNEIDYLYELGIESGYSFAVVYHTHIYVHTGHNLIGGEEKTYKMNNYKFKVVTNNPEDYKKEGVVYFIFNQNLELEQYEKLDFVQVSRWSSGEIQIQSRNINKGTAVEAILKNKMIPQGVITYGIGDEYNDIEMFETVDRPLALSHSIQDLKDLAWNKNITSFAEIINSLE